MGFIFAGGVMIPTSSSSSYGGYGGSVPFFERGEKIFLTVVGSVAFLVFLVGGVWGTISTTHEHYRSVDTTIVKAQAGSSCKSPSNYLTVVVNGDSSGKRYDYEVDGGDCGAITADHQVGGHVSAYLTEDGNLTGTRPGSATAIAEVWLFSSLIPLAAAVFLILGAGMWRLAAEERKQR